MAADNRHVDDRLDEWLDRRLDEVEGRAVESHLGDCSECRDLRDALVAGREAIRSALPDQPAPDGLEARIRAMLDREDRAARPAPASSAAPARPAVPPPVSPGAAPRRRSRGISRALLPLAAGLVLALLVGWWLARPRPPGHDAVDAAFEQLAALEVSALPVALRAADAETVELRWRRAGIVFPARVIDLAAMGITVAGGDATALAGAPAARTVYRAAGDTGEASRLLACWMFEGREAELPAPAEVRSHRGFEFRIYRRGDATLVVWREGGVLCALAGRGDPESVIGLAFGKAMAPSTGAPATSES